MYAAAIRYDFEVEDKTYAGNRISLSSENSKTSSAREVKKVLQKYSLGKPVMVYYDPDLPANAVLETGADILTYIIYFAPFLLVFFGILLLFQLLKVVVLLVIALFVRAKRWCQSIIETNYSMDWIRRYLMIILQKTKCLFNCEWFPLTTFEFTS